MGDGSFVLHFHARCAGTFDVFVRIDGLHVIGSPALMRIYMDEEAFNRCDPVARATVATAKAAAAALAEEQAKLEEESMPAVDATLDEVVALELPELVQKVQDEVNQAKVLEFQRVNAEKRAAAEGKLAEEAAKAALREAEAKSRAEAKANEKAAKAAKEKAEKAALKSMF
jgi:hypothetical protein